MPNDSTQLPIAPLPIDHLLLRGPPQGAALHLRDGTVCFAEVERRVARLAAILAARELGAGARIATWLGKGWLSALMPLAAVRAGYIHVPVNPLLKRAQVAHILADSGAALLISNAGRIASLESGDVPPPCAVVEDTSLSVDALAAGDMLNACDAPTDALAAILYTSGSTGRPKGVMLSHANLWLGAQSVAHYLGLTADDRLLGVLPFSFDYGQNQLLGGWYAGASIAPLDYLTSMEVVRAVERFGITTIAGVPPLWVQLLDCAWPDATAGHIKRITNSGGALTPRLVRGLAEKFPAARIFAMYGLTEAFRSTFLPPELIADRPESIGKAIPHAEILIVHDDGSPTEAGEAGELVHCGPLVAQGYWQDGERTALRFRPAPAHSQYGGTAVWSGDKAVRDGDGYLSFVGRDDEMIKTSGNRVSPTEVEEGAAMTGLVAESVAFGVRDVNAGATIALVARGAQGADTAALEGDLRAALRRELPNFMQPKYILLWDDLPHNANGKLDRVAIIAAASAELGG